MSANLAPWQQLWQLPSAQEILSAWLLTLEPPCLEMKTKVSMDAVLRSKKKCESLKPFAIPEGRYAVVISYSPKFKHADMHQRKQMMSDMADAVIALPGGVGTLEELLETLTWRQLGLVKVPVIILNTLGYYDSLLAMLRHAIDEGFMKPSHGQLWQVADTPQSAIALLDTNAKVDFRRERRHDSCPVGADRRHRPSRSCPYTTNSYRALG